MTRKTWPQSLALACINSKLVRTDSSDFVPCLARECVPTFTSTNTHFHFCSTHTQWRKRRIYLMCVSIYSHVLIAFTTDLLVYDILWNNSICCSSETTVLSSVCLFFFPTNSPKATEFLKTFWTIKFDKKTKQKKQQNPYIWTDKSGGL